MDGKKGSCLNRDGEDIFGLEKIFLNAGESNSEFEKEVIQQFGQYVRFTHKYADTFGFTNHTYQRFSYVSFFTRLYGVL